MTIYICRATRQQTKVKKMSNITSVKVSSVKVAMTATGYAVKAYTTGSEPIVVKSNEICRCFDILSNMRMQFDENCDIDFVDDFVDSIDAPRCPEGKGHLCGTCDSACLYRLHF